MTSERERCAQLVAELVPATYGAGQISTVQRWMTRTRRLRDQGVPAPGGPGRLGHRARRRHGRRPTVGGDRGRGVVRPGADGRGRVVCLVPGDAARHDVCRRAGADDGRRRVRRRSRRHRRARGGTPRSASSAEAHLLAGDVDAAGGRVRGGDVGRAGAGSHGHRRPQRVGAGAARDGGGPVGGGGRSRRRSLWASSRNTGCTTTPSACSPSRPRPGLPCTGRLSEADRRLDQGDAGRPASTFVLPFLAVRGRLQLAKVYTDARRPGQLRDTCCARSTTYSVAGRDSARWPTRSRSSASWRRRRRRPDRACRH